MERWRGLDFIFLFEKRYLKFRIRYWGCVAICIVEVKRREVRKSKADYPKWNVKSNPFILFLSNKVVYLEWLIYHRSRDTCLFIRRVFNALWLDTRFSTPWGSIKVPLTASVVQSTGKAGPSFYFRSHSIILEGMRTVEVASKKWKNEVSTRKIRCLSSPQSTLGWKLPPVSLAGMWLEEAGFEVGDFARIVVLDGVLVVSCELLPGNENQMGWKVNR